MTEAVSIDAEDVVSAPAPLVNQQTARAHPRRDLALRHRMRRQAQLMALVALMVLVTAFSVPFVLHYLDITIP
jgi:hypothetical protein